jgi:hypothetical protein
VGGLGVAGKGMLWRLVEVDFVARFYKKYATIPLIGMPIEAFHLTRKVS